MIGKKAAGSMTLEERIAQIRKDIDAFIDERVKAEKKLSPNLPLETLKHCIIRGETCHCQQFFNLLEQDELERESLARIEAARLEGADA